MEIDLLLLALALIGLAAFVFKTVYMVPEGHIEDISDWRSISTKKEHSSDEEKCNTNYLSLIGCFTSGSCVCVFLLCIIVYFILFRLDLGVWNGITQLTTIAQALTSA